MEVFFVFLLLIVSVLPQPYEASCFATYLEVIRDDVRVCNYERICAQEYVCNHICAWEYVYDEIRGYSWVRKCEYICDEVWECGIYWHCKNTQRG